MENGHSVSPGWITLNVGGTNFLTPKDKLGHFLDFIFTVTYINTIIYSLLSLFLRQPFKKTPKVFLRDLPAVTTFQRFLYDFSQKK